jgi:hypothetical protein
VGFQLDKGNSGNAGGSFTSRTINVKHGRTSMFAFDQWLPMTVAEVVQCFEHAPFRWGLAGGYAVEQFLGVPVRAHSDIDIVAFRTDQQQVQQWLAGWQLFAADPPGTLRPWQASEWLPIGIHDIWGYPGGATAWQLQIMLLESEGDEWVSRRHPALRGPRDALLVAYHGLPCLRIEVQLCYKAKGLRPKDEQDFAACLPHLDAEARSWLASALALLHPDGHPWRERLAAG